MEFYMFKIETFIPEDYVDKLRDKLNDVKALNVGGNYDSCMSTIIVKGSWRPLEGSTPFNGQLGRLCIAEEIKVEFCCEKNKIKEAINTIKNVHPYEEPVINIIPVFHYNQFI